MKHKSLSLKNAAVASFFLGGILSPSVGAATITLYDFEQYSNGSTGETTPADSSSDPRVYQPSTTLSPVTGITSVSNVSFTVSDTTTTDQNEISTKGTKTFRWRLNGPVVTASFTVNIAEGYQMENFLLSLIQTGNATGSFEVAYNGNTMGPTGTLDSDDTYDGDNDAYSTNVIASPVTGTVNFVITVDPDAAPRTSRWDNILLTGDIVAIPEPSSFGVIGLSGLAFLARRRRA